MSYIVTGDYRYNVDCWPRKEGRRERGWEGEREVVRGGRVGTREGGREGGRERERERECGREGGREGERGSEGREGGKEGGREGRERECGRGELSIVYSKSTIAQ